MGTEAKISLEGFDLSVKKLLRKKGLKRVLVIF
jgi:hypothetical protein